ncbi:galactose-binding domain-like protein [Gorgonomyces haynaldii]|nr:galactose-binding domain-like protein [Gorgonomyces haynaldii]
MREKCKDPKEDCEEFFFTDPITIENVIRPVATKSFLPLNTFQSYPDLASDSNGGRILFSTDDFFAVAENMISHTAPVWDEQKYTVFGKWMDGWETRRKRTLGHDWCIIELGLSGEIVGIDADTAFFTGNNVPAISIQAYNSKKSLPLKRRSEMGTRCTQEELDAAEALQSHKWKTILEKTSLRPDTRHHVIRLSASGQWTHLRVNIFPDGGIARLRVYGEVVPDWSKVSVPCDLVGLENGGAALEWSNAHYGSPMQLLQKQRSLGMFDGWETGILIIPGNEWAILRLGHRGIVQKLIVDTNHYKGNYPESCEILVFESQSSAVTPPRQTKWLPLISRTKLGPHKEHPLDSEFLNPITHVKLIMYPDGGISRLRLIGYPIQQARF